MVSSTAVTGSYGSEGTDGLSPEPATESTDLARTTTVTEDPISTGTGSLSSTSSENPTLSVTYRASLEATGTQHQSTSIETVITATGTWRGGETTETDEFTSTTNSTANTSGDETPLSTDGSGEVDTTSESTSGDSSVPFTAFESSSTETNEFASTSSTPDTEMSESTGRTMPSSQHDTTTIAATTETESAPTTEGIAEHSSTTAILTSTESSPGAVTSYESRTTSSSGEASASTTSVQYTEVESTSSEHVDLTTVTGKSVTELSVTSEYLPTFESSTFSIDNSTKAETAPPAAPAGGGTDVAVIVLACVASIALLILILLIVYILWDRHRRRHRSRKNSTSSLEMQPRARGVHWDPSLRQIAASELTVTTKLIGEGRFGPVYEGYLVNGPGDIVKVACKSLAEDSCEDDKFGFSSQIELYRTVIGHENFPLLFGIATTISSRVNNGDISSDPSVLSQHRRRLYAEDGVYGIFEFCHAGTLWSALRLTSDGATRYKHLKSLEGQLEVAIGVANGMRHLSSRGIVHRELCTIHVLLADDLTPKIVALNAPDIARAIYKAWSAPEVLENNFHTLMTDVWSYGVVLWEIITHGETPYAQIEPRDLLRHLNRGYRLPKPYGCQEAIYELMLSCWHGDPSQRPTFLIVSETIKKIQLENQLLRESLI